MKNLFLLLGFSAGLATAAPAPITLVKGSNLLTDQMIEVKPKEQGMIVVFLSAKCPCSASHVGEIKAMAKEFPQFQFVAVHSNSDESKELSRTYFKSVALGFPVVQDDGSKIANEFRALKTPHAFLLSPEGKTLYKGGVTDSKDCDKSGRHFLREAMGDVVRKQRVRTPEARTLGCAIARGGKNDG